MQANSPTEDQHLWCRGWKYWDESKEPYDANSGTDFIPGTQYESERPFKKICYLFNSAPTLITEDWEADAPWIIGDPGTMLMKFSVVGNSPAYEHIVSSSPEAEPTEFSIEIEGIALSTSPRQRLKFVRSDESCGAAQGEHVDGVGCVGNSCSPGPASSSDSVVQWDGIKITSFATATTYKVCYCAGPCYEPWHYTPVTIDHLTVEAASAHYTIGTPDADGIFDMVVTRPGWNPAWVANHNIHMSQVALKIVAAADDCSSQTATVVWDSFSLGGTRSLDWDSDDTTAAVDAYTNFGSTGSDDTAGTVTFTIDPANFAGGRASGRFRACVVHMDASTNPVDMDFCLFTAGTGGRVCYAKENPVSFNNVLAGSSNAISADSNGPRYYDNAVHISADDHSNYFKVPFPAQTPAAGLHHNQRATIRWDKTDTISLTGTGLTLDTAVHLIFDSDGGCDSTQERATALSVNELGTVATFEVADGLTADDVGTHYLCYASKPIGKVTITGTVDVSRTFVLDPNEESSIEVTGSSLQYSDRIMLIDGDSSCGIASPSTHVEQPHTPCGQTSLETFNMFPPQVFEPAAAAAAEAPEDPAYNNTIYTKVTQTFCPGNNLKASDIGRANGDRFALNRCNASFDPDLAALCANLTVLQELCDLIGDKCQGIDYKESGEFAKGFLNRASCREEVRCRIIYLFRNNCRILNIIFSFRKFLRFNSFIQYKFNDFFQKKMSRSRKDTRRPRKITTCTSSSTPHR